MNHLATLHCISCCRFIGRLDIRSNGYSLENDGDLARGEHRLQADKVHAGSRYLQFHVCVGRVVDRPIRCHHSTDELHRQV